MTYEAPKSMAAELKAWNNGEGISLDVWIGIHGDFQLAVGYAAVFWPRFKTSGHYILRESCWEESIAGFEKQQGATPQSVEWVLNHFHLLDLHINDAEAATADKLLFLGNMLKEMWAAKLQREFPDRPCVVEFYIPEDPDDLWEYQVSFWQKAWENDPET